MKHILLTAAAVLTLAACGSNTETESKDNQAVETNVDVTNGEVVTLSDDNMYRPGNPVSEPTIIDFNATWCGPCRAFKPVFHATAAKFPNVRFVSADVDKLVNTAKAYEITAVPTIVFISTNGNDRRIEGMMDATQFEELVKNFSE